MADTDNISFEIRRRRWNWIGHKQRREDGNGCITALGLQPEGNIARGRPKTTWRRTVEKEKNADGWTSWNTARGAAAKDRVGWRDSVKALCAYWRGEI